MFNFNKIDSMGMEQKESIETIVPLLIFDWLPLEACSCNRLRESWWSIWHCGD